MNVGDISLRIARREDLADVDALLARSYPRLLRPAYPPSVLVTALPIIARARPELLASGTYWVALHDDRIVGAGGWTRNAPAGGGGDPQTGHVRHLVTDDRLVRRGIARGLMQAVLAQAREAGLGRLECLSTRVAVPFYAAMGFQNHGDVDIPLRPGINFPAVAMSLSL